MSEFWLCFNCCIAEQPQPTLCTIASTFCLSLISYIRHTRQGNNDVFTQDAPPRIMVNDKRRRRIDRSMIGEPTNFVHTAHVGSGDLFSGMNSVHSVQNQMQSKGGMEVRSHL